jgi:hypothetical protein
LRVLVHAIHGGQALKEIVEKELFLGSHGVTGLLVPARCRQGRKYARDA